MKPTIGRTVHYQAHGSPNGQHKSEPRAAIITGVRVRDPEGRSEIEQDFEVSLCVLNPTGMYFNTSVPFSALPASGHWNWPPRE